MHWDKHILQIAAIIFLAGGGWMTLSQVQAVAEENKEKIEIEIARSQEIEKKLVRIETKQELIAEDVDDVQDKLDTILEAIRERHGE